MDQSVKQRIIEARRALHGLAELSGQERRTQAFLLDFLRRNTTLRVADRGGWLYAKHDEGAPTTTVVRADHDAVPTPGGPRHLCGHDGHTAALLGLALLLEGKRLGRNVILLFQPAEETGAGAALCCELFALEGLDRSNARIIGCHNIPGEPLGTLLFRRGCFACASCGLEIQLRGKPAHAACPENGVNPSAAAARLALRLPELARQTGAERDCMCLATIVGLRSGERAFGVAASEAALWATLRADQPEAFALLNQRADQAVRDLAAADGLAWSLDRLDEFPATVNDEAVQDELKRICREKGLPYRRLDRPFRWSEDFGRYGQYLPACFFGVGAGPDTAPLHTEGYCWPEALAPRTAELFLALLSR